MGALSEKEAEIRVGLLKASLLALYNNGKLDTVLCSIEVNGNQLTWHYSQSFGEHALYRLEKYTDSMKVLKAFITHKLLSKIKQQIEIWKN